MFHIFLLWLEEHSMMNILIVNGPSCYSIEAVSIFSQHSCSDKISPKNLPVKGLTNFTDLTLVDLILPHPGKCYPPYPTLLNQHYPSKCYLYYPTLENVTYPTLHYPTNTTLANVTYPTLHYPTNTTLANVTYPTLPRRLTGWLKKVCLCVLKKSKLLFRSFLLFIMRVPDQ